MIYRKYPSSLPSFFSLSFFKFNPFLSLSSHPSFLLLSLASSLHELPLLLPPLLKLGLLHHYPDADADGGGNGDGDGDLPDELCRTLLKGLAKHGPLEAALAFFATMSARVRAVVYNFTYLLKSCGDRGDLRRGRREVRALLVSHGFSSNLFAMTTLVNMYAKCRRVSEARKVFDGMPQRDLIAWNAMVAGYAQNGLAEVALRTAARIGEDDAKMRPDSITLFSALPACAGVGSLKIGR